jgi:AsmA protein
MKLKALVLFVGAGVFAVMGLFAAAVSAPGQADVPALSEALVSRLGEWMGGDVARHGTISLKTFFNMTLEAENVEIKGSKRFDSMLRLRAGKLSARLDWLDVIMGRPNFRELTLENVTIEAKAPPALVGASQSSPGSIGLGGFAPLFEIGPSGGEQPVGAFTRVRISNARVVFAAQAANGRRRVYPRLMIPDLQMTFDADGGQEISGDVAWRDQSFSVTAHKGAVGSPGSAMAGAPLELQLSNKLFALTASGELTADKDREPQFRGEASVGSANMAEASRWLKIAALERASYAGFGAGVFSAEGHVSWKGRELTISRLQIKQAAREITGALTIKEGAVRPEVEGALALSDFDLGALTGAGWDAGYFKSLNADLRVSVKKLVAGDVSGEAAALTLSLKDGKLSADLVDLAVLGGRVRGHFAFDASQPQRSLAVRATAADLDSAALSRAMNMTGWLTGGADLNVEARADAAGDWPTLLRSLSGEARVTFSEGGGVGLDLLQFAGADGAVRWSAGQAERWNWTERGFMKFDALRGEFAIEHGRIRSKSFELSTGEQAVAGRCLVDLAGKSIDWRFDIRPAEPVASGDEAASAGGSSEAVAGAEFAPSVIIKGPWLNPSLHVGEPALDRDGSFPKIPAPKGSGTG